MVGYLQPAYCVRYPDTPVPHVAVIHNRGRRRRRGVGYIAARCPGSPCRSGGLALRRGCRGTRSCSPASSDPPAPPGQQLAYGAVVVELRSSTGSPRSATGSYTSRPASPAAHDKSDCASTPPGAGPRSSRPPGRRSAPPSADARLLRTPDTKGPLALGKPAPPGDTGPPNTSLFCV